MPRTVSFCVAVHRTFFLLILLLFLNREADAQRLPYTVYTTAQGLVHNRCHGMRQDDLGYLWIGTDIGIARFDGRTFTYYPSPAAPYVAAPPVMVDKGWVVFGLNEHGPVRCRGDVVQHIRARSHKVGWLSGITTAPDGGYLVSDQANGLLHVSPDGHSRLLDSDGKFGVPTNGLLDLFRDSRGTLWITHNKGLLVCPSGEPSSAREHPYFRGLFTNLVREGPDGLLYATCFKGLVRMQPVTDAHSPLPEPEMLYPQHDVSGIAFMPDALWCSSAPDGVTRVDGPGRYTRYGLSAGLPAASAWDAFRDREGVLWFATENGLVKLARTDVSLVDFSGTDYPGVKTGVPLADGSFLFGNNKVMQRWKDGHITTALTVPALPWYAAQCAMRGPGNELWMTMNNEPLKNTFEAYGAQATLQDGGLSKLQLISNFAGAPSSISTASGSIEDGGDQWVIGDGRLLHYTGGRFEPAPVLGNDGEPANPVALCNGATPGSAWMIDSGAYLIRCAVQRDAAGKATLRPVEYLPRGLLRGSRFRILHADRRGRVYLGGREGLAVCNRLPAGSWACANYGKVGEANSSNWITSLCEDADGNIWIGTANGLDKMRAGEAGFPIERGLLRAELCGSFIYFVRAVGQQIFVGTTGCMAVLDLGTRAPFEPPPMVHLTSLSIGGAPADSLLRGARPARLQPDQNYLSFSFLGISFKDERGVRYRYRLDGLDDAWNGLTPDNRITYSAIPPGDYTFRVEAQSASGQWSAKPASFSFMVLQPFYTRWWFILAAALVVGAAVYGIYRYRLAQVMAIQRIRSKISKDLHDDIGATVSSIGILASIAGKNELKEEKRHQYLDTISDQSKYVAETLSDIVWAINPNNDSLEKLFARVLRYATELFEARGIDYTVDAPPDALRGLSLPMDARQNLYLVIKEAVNNLVKYSGATHAIIRVAREPGHLAVSISDDGKGFDPETATGNGLPNLRKRAEALHGTLRIVSRQGGGGTRVELQIPLKAGARMM